MPLRVDYVRTFTNSTADAGGPLPPGVRAAPGLVGYLGAPHAPARTLNISDPIPAELPGCVWDGNVLRVNADNVTIDNWHINAAVDCYGANLTVSNCVINNIGGSFYGILCRQGDLDVSDTTVTGPGDATAQGQAVSLDPGGTLTVRRCDLSGYQDAVGIIQGLVSQCWIHDIALASTFHSDGIQIFGGGTSAVVEHSFVDIRGPGTANSDGAHQNGAVYTDLPSGPAGGVVINNNFLAGGAFFIVLSGGASDVVVTNNTFGPLDGTGLGEWTVNPPSTVGTWFGNTHFDGSPSDFS